MKNRALSLSFRRVQGYHFSLKSDLVPIVYLSLLT